MADWMTGLHSQVRDFAKGLLAEGWEHDRTSGKNHPRMVWLATGERISLPSTPSDIRSIPNTAAQARRISGLGPVKHKGPHFRHVHGSGFDVLKAKHANAAYHAAVDVLEDEIHVIDATLQDLHPRHDRAQCLELCRRRQRAADRLTALRIEAPEPPQYGESA